MVRNRRAGPSRRRWRGDPAIASELVGDLYGSIEDRGRWEQFVTRLGRASRADVAAVAWRSMDSLAAVVARGERARELARALVGLHADLVAHPREARVAALPRQLCEQHGLGDGLVLLGPGEGRADAFCCIATEHASGRLRDDARALLRRIAPHFALTVRLGQRLGSQGVIACTEGIASAVFRIASDGRLHGANGAARELVSQGWARISSDGAVELSTPHASAQLAAVIHETLSGSAPGRIAPGRHVPVPGPGGARVDVFVAPWIVGDDQATGALVLVGVRRAEDLVALTPAQRGVAERLASGATVAEAAADLGVSVETVRSHLKEVYRKLGIASRAELARRML